MSCTIDPQGLARRMETSSDLTILDVLLPEHYQAYHIPGALNACVYEMVFLDTVQKLVPDKSAPIVVYDTSRRSQASANVASLDPAWNSFRTPAADRLKFIAATLSRAALSPAARVRHVAPWSILCLIMRLSNSPAAHASNQTYLCGNRAQLLNSFLQQSSLKNPSSTRSRLRS